MKTLLFAYFGGMAASIPAFMMFSEVGTSPYRDYDLVLRNMGYSLSAVLTYYALILFVPALGSAIGAKLGGRGVELHYMYGRGVGGQFIGILVFGILLSVLPNLESAVYAMDAPTQTIVALATAQVGCTLGTVWGL
jgi:hypothetical protein